MTSTAWDPLVEITEALPAWQRQWTPPLSLLRAIRTLLGDAPVRYVDALVEEVGDRTRWRIVAASDDHLVWVDATGDGGWVYRGEGSADLAAVNAGIVARCWPLSRVSESFVDAPPDRWVRTGQDPVPPVGLRVEGMTIPIPLNPTVRAKGVDEQIRSMVALLRAARVRSTS